MKLDNLKSLLNGLTLKELERRLGFGNGTISRWETNSPSIDKIVKVANYFDVSVDFLLCSENIITDEGHYLRGGGSTFFFFSELSKLMKGIDKLDDEDQKLLVNYMNLLLSNKKYDVDSAPNQKSGSDKLAAALELGEEQM